MATGGYRGQKLAKTYNKLSIIREGGRFHDFGVYRLLNLKKIIFNSQNFLYFVFDTKEFCFGEV